MSTQHTLEDNISFPTEYTDWIIGISGGVDSLVLLDLCVKYVSKSQNTHRLYPVHLNHQTRGKNSDNDQKLSEKVCQQYGLELYSKSLNVKNIASVNQLNFEEAARIERHKLFYELCNNKRLESPIVLLAHHHDDQEETILMRLMRGSGMRGLQGILESAKLPIYPEITQNQLHVFRPLLKVPKSNIIKHAVENNLEWREDKSNTDTDYTRNLLRNIVLPTLKVIDQSVSNKLDEISNISKLIDSEIMRESAEISHTSTRVNIKIDENSAKMASDAAFFRLVEELCCKIFPGFLLPRRAYLTLGKLKSSKIKATDIAQDIHIFEYDGFFNIYNKNQKDILIKYTEMPDKFKFESESIKINITRKILDGEIPNKENKNIEHIPISFSKKPLLLSNLNRDIRIKQLGLNRSQKLTKLLKNHKIPYHIRSQIPVIYSGSEPLWVVGVTLCEAAKLESLTGEVFCLEYSEKTL